MRVKSFPLAPAWSQTAQPWWLPAGVAPTFDGESPAAQPSAATIGPRVELLEWNELAGREEAWRNLLLRSHERNVFLEPGFAVFQAQHQPAGRRPQFLLIWGDADRSDPAKLIGFFSLHLPRPGTGRVARLWLTRMMTLSTPLLDRTRSLQAVDLLHRYLATHHPHIDALVLPQVAIDGPVAEILRRHAGAHGLTATIFDRKLRAIATRSASPDWFLKEYVSAKKRKELARQRRRLSEQGEVSYTSSTKPAGVRAAVEKFLALEASGWKGESETALLCDPSKAAFVRAMTRQFAQTESCRVDALEVDGKPVAMGIILCAGRSAYYWKTTYNEAYSRYSPGVLFTIEMTQKLIEAGIHDIIDSCAIPNHPMIDQLWPERIAIGDLFIATLRGQGGGHAVSLAKERVTRTLRCCAKRAWYKLRNKTPS